MRGEGGGGSTETSHLQNCRSIKISKQHCRYCAILKKGGADLNPQPSQVIEKEIEMKKSVPLGGFEPTTLRLQVLHSSTRLLTKLQCQNIQRAVTQNITFVFEFSPDRDMALTKFHPFFSEGRNFRSGDNLEKKYVSAIFHEESCKFKMITRTNRRRHIHTHTVTSRNQYSQLFQSWEHDEHLYYV